MNDISAISLEGLKGWGGWGLCSLWVIWWIRGMPERRRAKTEAEASLRVSYGDHIDRLTVRIDKMEAEHESDRNSWIAERTALRNEYEADHKRWNAEREQWRRERLELLDQVDGLERKLRSYGSSVRNIEEGGGANAPTTVSRLIPDQGTA